MIRGMTGKASLRFSTDTLDVEMEIRSVNLRYFEFRMKCPSRYSFIEMDVRKLVSQKLERGKIDLSIWVNENEISGSLINHNVAKSYVQEAKILAEEMGIPSTMSIREILSLPQVLNGDTSDLNEETTKLFLQKIDELVDLMLPMMMEEGKSTLIDLQNSLSTMVKSLDFIRDRYPLVLEKYKNALLERVQEITSTKVPEERLIIELELFASRTAINEEIVRLDNHIRVMNSILDGSKKDSSSKELDFIAQEMNREVNTIASKSSDFDITSQTIILKSEIEKMREQFRNIV